MVSPEPEVKGSKRLLKTMFHRSVYRLCQMRQEKHEDGFGYSLGVSEPFFSESLFFWGDGGGGEFVLGPMR